MANDELSVEEKSKRLDWLAGELSKMIAFADAAILSLLDKDCANALQGRAPSIFDAFDPKAGPSLHLIQELNKRLIYARLIATGNDPMEPAPPASDQ